MILMYKALDSLTEGEKRRLHRDLDRMWSKLLKLKRVNEQLEKWIRGEQ